MPKAVKGRKRPGVNAGEAANLLNAIHQDGLNEREILRILQPELATCDHIRSPCRANRKDNFACFCQFVPAETSFRKKGLWQKEQAHLASLGRDPVEDQREANAKPAGLRNLGNTCYANAALQCLFSIPSLRNGVFTAESRVAAHDIFRKLQSLFLQMQFGPRSSVDTEGFAKTLGLNHAIQQDGQEFLKLLLTRVEQMLSKSGDLAARGLVQRLFRGGLSYVTTCKRCGRDSASSREVQDFYDLMPQVRGFTSLTESLAAILHADSLTGENRYRCEFCADKVDALRHVRLRSLPPYLCLALQRFYFDPRTADKAKALDKFSFPLQLDFRQVLATAAAANAAPMEGAAPDASGAKAAAAAAAAEMALEVPSYAAGSPLYELVGILIHKGSQASSGHYVAHIKDQSSGVWWRFDDEIADCIGPSPTAAFQNDHGSPAAPAAAAGADGGAGAKGTGASRKRAAPDPDYEDEEEGRDQQSFEDEGPSAKATKGGRGKKAAAQSRPRGRPSKRAAGAGTGRGRGRPRAVAMDADTDGDDDMARAMAASLAAQNGGGDKAAAAGTATGQEEEDDLRRALEASLVTEQRSRIEDAEMEAALAESARVLAGTPVGADGGVDDEHSGGAASKKRIAPPDGAATAAMTSEGRGRADPGGVIAQGLSTDVAVVGESFGPALHMGGQPLWAGGSEDAGKAPATAEGVDTRIQVVSANAYMLVYRAVGFHEPPVAADAASLPGDLQEVASAATATFAESCDAYRRQLQALRGQVAARQRAVREVMASITPALKADEQPSQEQAQPTQEEPINLADGPAGANGRAEDDGDPAGGGSEAPQHGAPASSQGTLGYWVSAAWLERWANDEGDPPPVDNEPIVCTSHGAPVAAKTAAAGSDGEGGEASCARLDPRKVSAAKLVSPQAWKRLLAAHGGGPTLAAGDVCRECLANNFSAALLGSQADVVRARVASLLEDSGPAGQADAEGDGSDVDCVEDTEGGPEARRFWVSKLWLQGWSKRQGASVKAEKSPTADIACPHRRLLPSVKTARRVAVPNDVWCFLRSLWRQQRLREAQEAHEQGATKPGRKAARSGSVPAPTASAVPECLDLTADDTKPVPVAQRGAAGNGSNGGVRFSGQGGKVEGGGGDEDDDDAPEIVEKPEADARAGSCVPSSREGTADVGEAAAGGASNGGAAAAAAVPTLQELDALCPELQVGRVHECRECRAVAGQVAEVEVETRRQVDAERTALGGLAAEVMPMLELGASYYLVPSAWVGDWQQYVKPVSRRGGPGGAGAAGSGAASGSSSAAAAAQAPNARPGPVSDAMQQVLCRCHPNEARLGVPVPRLTLKRNKLCQQDPDQDALRIIHPDDWRQLCRLYGTPGPAAPRPEARGGGDAGVGGASAAAGTRRPQRKTRAAAANGGKAAEGGPVQIDLVNGDDVDVEKLVLELEAPEPAGPGQAAARSGAAVASATGGSEEGTAVRREAVLKGFEAVIVPPPAASATPAGGGAAADAADLASPSSQLRDRSSRESPPLPQLRVWPPVCSEALAAHSRAAKEAMLSYKEAEVMLELVPQDELEGAFRSTIQAPERKSKRSRKGRIALTVSNTTTLEQLKLQVYEHMSIHPRNQSLYVRGAGSFPRLLEGDELSLAQHEVLPGEEIRLVRSNVVDDDDVANLLGADEGRGKKRQVEEGFKNTALHGDLPQQQQQAQQAVAEAAGPSGATAGSSAHQSEDELSDG